MKSFLKTAVRFYVNSWIHPVKNVAPRLGRDHRRLDEVDVRPLGGNRGYRRNYQRRFQR